MTDKAEKGQVTPALETTMPRQDFHPAFRAIEVVSRPDYTIAGGRSGTTRSPAFAVGCPGTAFQFHHAWHAYVTD